MCGIAGAVGNRDGQLARRMNAALYHRGPDSEGYFRGADIDLAMRRLSIIDLRTGDQPIYNEARDKCVVFNGEIYNYRELRRELEAKGHTFETTTDTEVIIHLYEEYGAGCVRRLRGMFAFAIADGGRLFLARDRLGIKPLYYAHLEERGLFIFASEIKALLQCAALPVALNRRALGDRLVLGYAFGDETYFEGIKSLPPGHYLTAERLADGVAVRRESYYEVSLNPDASLAPEAAERRLGEVLDDAVRCHLVADVKVGLTLSGGVDSSFLAFAMRRHYPERISTFTVADAPTNIDLRQSRALARHLVAEHDEALLGYDEYVRALPACALAEEQPPSLYALPFFHLCRRIGGRMKVCLNGEGADELFGGYPEYSNRAAKLGALRAGLEMARARRLPFDDAAAGAAEDLLAAPSYAAYLERLLVFNLRDQLVRFHLDLIDKYAMASSLEVRVPFLDNEVVDFANSLPLDFKVNRELGVGKYLLKRLAVNSFGSALLDAVMRRKVGFPASALHHHARFKELCGNNLPDEYADRHELAPFVAAHGTRDRAALKRELLLLDLFSFIFIEQRGAVPEGFSVGDFLREKSERPTLVEQF